MVRGFALQTIHFSFLPALAFGAPVIARLFAADGAAIPLLHVAAAFQVADAANVVARGILRGTGDVRFPAVVGIGAAWARTPPLTWLFGHGVGLGAFGGWLGLSAEILAAAGIFWWRLVGRGWRHASRAQLAAGRVILHV